MDDRLIFLPFCCIKLLIILLFVTGYDMQFDIKYAYFNFLQSISYPSTCNLKLAGTECEDSGSDVCACLSKYAPVADVVKMSKDGEGE